MSLVGFEPATHVTHRTSHQTTGAAATIVIELNN